MPTSTRLLAPGTCCRHHLDLHRPPDACSKPLGCTALRAASDMATAEAELETPLAQLDARYADTSSSEDEGGGAGEGAGAAAVAAGDAAEPQAQHEAACSSSDDGEGKEEDESELDSEEEEALAQALEWADLREGASSGGAAAGVRCLLLPLPEPPPPPCFLQTSKRAATWEALAWG